MTTTSTEPKVIFEILSPSTERIDRLEKFWAHMELESFEDYVQVDQQQAHIEIFRRTNDWLPEITTETDASLHLSSIDFTMSIAEVYAGLE